MCFFLYDRHLRITHDDINCLSNILFFFSQAAEVLNLTPPLIQALSVASNSLADAKARYTCSNRIHTIALTHASAVLPVFRTT